MTAPSYTHCTTTEVLRLDLIYLSATLQRKKRWVETIVAVFTDHLAIVTRMESSDSVLRGRGFWRINTTLLSETAFRQLQDKWIYWRTHGKYYPATSMWW